VSGAGRVTVIQVRRSSSRRRCQANKIAQSARRAPTAIQGSARCADVCSISGACRETGYARSAVLGRRRGRTRCS
jgi:hypothetical protein